MEVLESEHRLGDSLDQPVILLDNVVQILALPNGNPSVFIDIVLSDRSRVCSALVNVDQAWFAIISDGLSQIPQGRLLVTLGGQQEVDRFTVAIHGAVVVFPLALDLQVGLIQAPATVGSALLLAERLLEQWSEVNHPAMECAVVNVEATLLHHLLEIAIAQRIGQIPTNALENHLSAKVPALEGNRCHFAHPKGRRFYHSPQFATEPWQVVRKLPGRFPAPPCPPGWSV